jgi:hypothetical protein
MFDATGQRARIHAALVSIVVSFFFFFWIHYCAPRETKPHVALRECVQYYVCSDMNEGPNNSGFFSHSKEAIDTQRNYDELAGTVYACQMTVMLVVIRVPPGLLSEFAGVCAGPARAATLRGEKWKRGRSDA